MKHIQAALFSLIFLSSLFANAQTAPEWFDLKSRLNLVQKKAQKDKVTKKIQLEKVNVRPIDLGPQKLTLLTAQFGEGGAESTGLYNLSEIYASPTAKSKPLFQILDKTGCETKLVEDVVTKKLGFINDIQVYFAQVQFLSPSCPNATGNPKVFLVLQELKKNIEKVYESEVSENGRYRVAFSKEIIRLEYAKNLNSNSKEIELHWNHQTQKFEEAK